jgi:hypothetical protein
MILVSLPGKVKYYIVTNIYLTTRWPCHASLWHSVVAWMRNISVPENYGFDNIICDYFYMPPFPTPTFTVHINGIRGIITHITETKMHIRYSESLFLFRTDARSSAVIFQSCLPDPVIFVTADSRKIWTRRPIQACRPVLTSNGNLFLRMRS